MKKNTWVKGTSHANSNDTLMDGFKRFLMPNPMNNHWIERVSHAKSFENQWVERIFHANSYENQCVERIYHAKPYENQWWFH